MKDLAKTYEAKSVDADRYRFWTEGGFFRADPLSVKPAYCIVMPPPNVTGVLHMGHALVSTLQDILIRFKRMSGFEVLWVPGTDHAGIATQTVVERHLLRTENKKRSEFEREEFLSHVWDWKEKSETRILDQIRRLGCSCDWSRLRFTMDDGNNRAVRTMFKKLFDDGLIYLGDYLVNWDPVTQTALGDDEVEYEERESFLWTIDYPLADGSGFISVATTRPETMLGDTAVAVAPGDERYSAFVGKEIRLPVTGRLVPIIADRRVDPAFGTGAVKVTPAHDPNDYQIGITHRLPMINILTSDGRINENGAPFEGLSVEEARPAVVKRLQEEGLLRKIDPHTHRVGLSYRSKAVIQPYLSKQWFVKMEGFAAKLKEAVTLEKIKLTPSNWESTYFHWIDNLRDWCISRQIWWGHRIPVWIHAKGENRMICYDGEGIPPEVAINPEEWKQDPDVLDTWFSSALWPFSSLGWPDRTPELAKFYPNATLVTGHDILFFWVTRMMAMGEYATGTLPFPKCFLNGLIYGKSYWRNNPEGGIRYVTEEERIGFDLGKPVPKDVFSKWEKMSKSKGNIIDPLETIDEYGTDAVRMALCASAGQSAQIDLDRRRFEEYKNFTNKIWNGARFVLLNLLGNEADHLPALSLEELLRGLDKSLFSLEDKWILSVLSKRVESVNRRLDRYEFDRAASEAYDFFWKEFCAYYVEISKPVLFGKSGTVSERTNKQKLMTVILSQAIRLLHPMAPFITEELFGLLKDHFKGIETVDLSLCDKTDSYTKECIASLRSPACIVAPYPEPIFEVADPEETEQAFALMEQVVYTVRNIRGEMKLPPGTATDLYIIGRSDDSDRQIVETNIGMLSALVRVRKTIFQTMEPDLEFACTGTYKNLKIMIPLPEENLKQEIVRLTKEQSRLSISLEKLRELLANPEFTEKAPDRLIESRKQQAARETIELEEIDRKLESFQDEA